MILNISQFTSIFISILLINGFFNLSYKCTKPIEKVIFERNKLVLATINFFLIINFFSTSTYIYTLFYSINVLILKLTSILIICFGFYKPEYLLSFLRFSKIKDYKLYIIYLILFFYFLLSLSPITDPDSLDYHITIPLYQLNFYDHPIDKYWLTSQLSGSGESIFLYGLILNGLNFSQFLQFFSLFLLILLILNFNNKSHPYNDHNKYFVVLCILIMPVFLFLTSTSKPQIFPIVTNFISLILCSIYLPKLNKKNSIICFTIIIYLLICSTQFKFSFFLSSALIIGLALFEMFKKKIIVSSVFIVFILSSLLILPREIYEFINLNQNVFYNFFNPVTDPYASENYNFSLKHGTGNPPYLPIWIFLPYPQLTGITYCLGITSLYFIFNFNFKKIFTQKILLLSTFFILLALIFAQPVGRFFIEPFVWLLFFSLFYSKNNQDLFFKYANNFIIIISTIYLILLSYYSINLFKGNFNKKLYEKVLEKNADGYHLYKWANSILPDNTVIISSHRSLALYKYKALSYEFRLYEKSYGKEGYTYYMNNILKEKPSYILYSSSELNNNLDIFKNCRGDLFSYKKDIGHTAGRNPLFKKKYYDGYIYELDIDKLKNCKL